MILGIVNDSLEVTIQVVIVGSNGKNQAVTALIDTGYNGSLTLPIGIVSELSLPQGASRIVTLGDASQRPFDYYNATVEWDSGTRRARILCVEGDPLIGTQLVEDFNMSADFVRGGSVRLGCVEFNKK